ncbi:NAD(P)/FAD-dependent oxidoreductase [Salinibacterium sp. dk2585]|uniref:NAD(P)/FAD-dependent oxidoreductase n=1 Tax=unclassified Salinibacterium TaxID=2632331 RepID=UPI0011C24A0B|nr:MULTISPECIES: NAD(P)/FAD-dependent oxidoreductase [unclassified Salinibacterium]QEE61944.1 NAD(P)/FAD-dependent oxidoreductase [Salinibacterium sp. dk2585]TXK54501.1 NAD(P)/FAD-dependent oxidoreductase [Salinibacterium sp. dk5596]
MPKILIVGGGYAGFYTALKLEKLLRRGEAEVTVVDPLPYMTYQPFLPEVAAGTVESRHAVVPLRRHLKSTNVVAARVTAIDHASKTATITPEVGEEWAFEYDIVVVTAGAITRTFPIPGIADNAFGLKTIEEAAAIRDRIVGNFEKASALPPGPERDRLLTITVVGGGFAGIEVFAELRSFASALLAQHPNLSFDDTHFHLIEAMDRIMPEVSLKTSHWVLDNLKKRGAEVHLETQLTSAVDGRIETSTGQVFESDTIIWTAGVMAHPVLRNTDLPLEERGRLRLGADLRARTEDGEIVTDVWGAGDVSAVPDLSGGGVAGMCVPNAQHAVRQGKLLAKNLVGHLRGDEPREYFHKNLGAVAGLGIGHGVFQSGGIAVKGGLAWLMHRGYHGLAMPMWERKARVFGNWIISFLFRRDTVGIEMRNAPRAVFEEYAARPKAAPARK